MFSATQVVALCQVQERYSYSHWNIWRIRQVIGFI